MRTYLLRIAAAALATTALLSAQCTTSWLPGDPYPTPVGAALGATVWDPDGTGPMSSWLIAGGALQQNNPVNGSSLRYDGSTWAPVGIASGTTVEYVVWNGQLCAALQNNVTPVSTTIRRWDGSTWQALGVVNGSVLALSVYNNQLIVGGLFSSVEGVAASSIARFDGTTWSPLGFGTNGAVRALGVYNNILRVGGSFSSAGGQPAGNLAYWNGSTWSIGPSFNGQINAMAVLLTSSPATSYLWVGGAFSGYTSSGQSFSTPRFARLDSSGFWTSAGTGAPASVPSCLRVRSTGLNGFELVAGFEDTTTEQLVWRFSAGSWAPLPAVGEPEINRVNDILFYAGRWHALVNSADAAIRSFDGTAWAPLVGQGIDGTVHAVEPRGSGVVIAGTFAKAGGVVVNGIAAGNATTWAPLGSGMTGGTGVFALATAPNGDLIAGGDFTSAGGVPCNRIARWDGTAWAPLGSGVDGAVRAVRVLGNGDVIAGGEFLGAGGVPCHRVARWNGSSWSAMGAGFSGPVWALAVGNDGQPIAGGAFGMSGGVNVARLARWNGAGWSPLGSGCNDDVFALAVAPAGELYAAGRFSSIGGNTGRIGRWAGSSWTAVTVFGIGSTEVRALAVHPGGDLFVGGGTFGFTLPPLGSVSSNLVRISPSGTGSFMGVAGTQVRAIALPGGHVAIGGRFNTVDSRLSVNYARLDTTCPATAEAYGTGCSGANGPLTLTPVSLPWLGSTYRARASGLASNALVFGITGLAPTSVPLASLHPAGGLGCSLLASAAATHLLAPVGGTATTQLGIPNSISLVGVMLHEQVLHVELDASQNITAVGSTNGLALTIGTF